MLRKLAGQTAIYGISSIAARLLNYLLTPYLTRIMSPSEYGVITDMYALIPFALVVLTMGMETGYFRFAGKATSSQEKENIFSTTWAAVSYVGLAFFSIVAMFNQPIAQAIGYSNNPSYVWIIGAIISLDVITAIPFARLREQGRAKRFVIVRVFSVVINVALCLFFYSALPSLAALGGVFETIYNPEFGAGYVFVANLVASIFTLIILIPTCGKSLPRIDKKLFRTILLYSLPLLISGVAGTANEFIDRQMIKFLMPEGTAMSALGIYGAVVKIGVVLMLFTQMYRLAAEPFFLAGFKKEDFVRTNAEALKYFIIVSVGIFLFIALFADLFALIIGADFRQGMYILPVVLLANILSGIVLNLSFWYKQSGQTKYAIYVTGTGLVFTVGLNIIFVPAMGYIGAAWARLFCEAAMVGISLWLNMKYFPTPYNFRRIGEYLFLGGVIYAIGLFTADLSELLKYFVNLCLVSTFGVYALRREKINIRRIIK